MLIIDRDYINTAPEDQEFNRVGCGIGGRRVTGTFEGPTYRFRLSDEDGEVHFGGKCDARALEDDDSEAVGMWQWAMQDTGATEFELHIGDAIKLGLWRAEYRDRDGQTDRDWVSIYG